MTGDETLSGVAPHSTEFLASVAARELAGRRRVFAGVGLPTLAVDLARRTTNPDVELVYESGVVGAHPEAMAEGIADSVLVSGAEAMLGMDALFGYVLQGGNVDVGFLGAAQVDRVGNLNTGLIGDWDRPTVRLPGSGGACDIIASAEEIVVVLRRHDPQALPSEVDFCTSPSPVRARQEAGFHQPSGFGVAAVITPLGILRRPDRYGELELAAVHPGVGVDEVRAATGWPLRLASDVAETPRPSTEEVRLLREEIDTVRLYLR
ncbi:3-oxoadipate--succinyl-CoA transferase [Prauserella rugosa]|uniref:Glutaconate CoA-transferase subunit B n=1 Tax=Prauserella rugosa TaxID=43354 RepID=A0A660CAS3_9PSEU|nr:3-oxoadipate--succinyl-CoA transferase [Prauserella rugosa]KMS88784.1 3-oxoadipate:succinyl-CoA transferase [Streptomyces regensis]TWH20406.1 glutaconate CoA-transferase subunit B [Prauserella rugosa]